MLPIEHRTAVNIDFPATLPAPHRAALAAARPILSWAVALAAYRELYDRLDAMAGKTFCARAMSALGLTVDVSAGDLLQIPETGPLIVVANHPHGLLDGLSLGSVLEQRRRDVRILTNHLISQLPGLSDFCFFVDPADTRPAAGCTRKGLRAALEWLEDGHALIVFPAGEVAHRMTDAGPIDSPWRDTVIRLASRTGAAIVPAFIAGGNSNWFYRAGRLHPSLRTLLLPRELLRKRGGRVALRIGSVVTAGEHAAAGVEALRRAVYRLATRHDDIVREIAALGPDARLVAGGEFDVFCARAEQAPSVLEEIGRLREVTFRAVGEGTGRACDLDRFDHHYLHLFVWNRERSEVVGAYRLGLVDEIVDRHGVNGLYTSTLFRYDERLLQRISPAIELGRSFVRQEYQRSSSALLLLWKGIAAFVARSEKYRVLFGPVSISSRYADASQQLLQAFLEQNAYRRELGQLVEAYTPPATGVLPRGVDPTLITDVRDLDSLVATLERDGKGMPVLLRQYLRLNATLLGFNVDPCFGNALDALMMVDLAGVAPQILSRYFGKAEAANLLARFDRRHVSAAA